MAPYRQRKSRRRPRRRRRYHGRGRLTVLLRFLSFLIICSAIAAALILFFKTQKFVVSGNQRYTEQQIIDSTGVAYGDNLFLLNKYAISGQITRQLPYIEHVGIRRGLPDTLIITVEECKPAVGLVQDGEGWLISASGKLLEKVSSAQVENYPTLQGVELLLPTEGSTMELPEGGNATEEQILGLVAALESRGMTGEVSSIDCSDPEELEMEYAGRFQVIMNYDDNFDQDLEALQSVIAQLQPNETGKILLTNVSEKVNFVPDR